MSDWELLPRGVDWRSPPLFDFWASRAAMVQSFGPPPLVDVDSNGIGPFDAWPLRFRCGLEVCLWIFRCRVDFSTVSEPGELSVIEHANAPHERHVRFHLPVPVGEVLQRDRSHLLPEPLVWRLLRQDDNGVELEVSRYPSSCEAEAALRAFESRAHKQMYWVEGPPVSRSASLVDDG